ncbi:hypothetical protein [Maribacter sp. Asnod1-A12]|uniref:hypothetical protein n=1 Tax=Maribacter sp. Asnod1-A12 TaxID=3160576 RepID=UPI00386F0339
MKTYNLVACFTLVLILVACEKSSDEVSEENKTSIEANYTVFVKNDDLINVVIVESVEEQMTVKNMVDSFGDIPSSSKKFKTSKDISFYFTSNCEANLKWLNLENMTTKSITVFSDLDPCSIEVTATAHIDSSAFIAYERELLGKDKQFLVRINSLTEPSENFSEIILDKKPLELVVSTNRLFVLTLNEYVSNEYHLSVIDLNDNTILSELDLGYDASRLFKNNSGQILVSYPKLHTTIDPISLDETYTTYGENTEPGFITTEDFYSDTVGRFYFQKKVPTAIINEVPAVYDFESNSTVVYLFENFLTETELTVKYNIEANTAISYDEANNYILIGYKKKGQSNEGGILRITPAPDFKFIDNINLTGVPQTIFAN